MQIECLGTLFDCGSRRPKKRHPNKQRRNLYDYLKDARRHMASAIRLQPARLRSWLNRIPLFSRIVLFVITSLYILSFFVDELPLAGALIPEYVTLLKSRCAYHFGITQQGLTSREIAAFRLNTYPFVHTGIVQTLFTLIALLPLLERFEGEHGTLVCLALFCGPFSTIPAAIYIFFDHILLRSSHAILGARYISSRFQNALRSFGA